MSDTRPLRVAHIVGAMNRAGVETWLMNVARNVSPATVELTFVKHSSAASDYDDEILALGHRIAVNPHPRSPLFYASRLRRLLRGGDGKFDALHSHVGHFSALPLVVAWSAGVSIRIAHSHSDNRPAQRTASFARRAYFTVSSATIRRFSTIGLASNEGACESLFRRKPRTNGAFQVLPTGIDLSKFPHASTDIRAELGLRPRTLLVGHIGRFVEVKNHRMLIAIARHWNETSTDSHLILVGEGPLRTKVEQEVRQAGLAGRVSFLGVRSDIPGLLSAFDVLVLPSLYEGVPVTLLEAQASGCRCLVSTHVDDAVDVVPGMISRLDIDGNVAEWASEAVRLGREQRAPADRSRALDVMRRSHYNIEVTLERLQQLWSTGR